MGAAADEPIDGFNSPAVPGAMIEVSPRERSSVIGIGRTYDAPIPIAIIGGGVAAAVVGRGVPAPGIGIAPAVAAVIGRGVAAVIAGIAAVIAVARTVCVGRCRKAANHRARDQSACQPRTEAAPEAGFCRGGRRHSAHAERADGCQNKCCLIHVCLLLLLIVGKIPTEGPGKKLQLRAATWEVTKINA